MSGLARRHQAILAGGCVLAAAALALGPAQTARAAAATPARHVTAKATPGPGWHTYNPGLGTEGSLLGLYAPTVGSAWAAGENASGDSAYLKFDGSSWASVSGPSIGPVADIGGTSASDVWVIGATKTARYNGSTWKTYPLDIPSGLTGKGFVNGVASSQIFAASSTDAYAEVDAFSSTHVREILEHFNGSKWTLVTNAPNISVDGSVVEEVTGSGPDDVYAIAIYDSGQKWELVHFNGTAWATESLPGTPYNLDISVTGAGTALVLGYQNKLAYAAGVSNGKWSLVSLPSGQAPSGTDDADQFSHGAAFAELTNGATAPVLTLWKYAGGTWTQITPEVVEGNPIIGVASGGGMWSFQTGGSAGCCVPADTALYVG
jgi:hypothetical protein